MNGGESIPQQTVLANTQVIGVDTTVESIDDEDLEDEDEPGISIETNKDGTLKLSCADPEMLQVSYSYYHVDSF
jgi:hypothetical protein